MVLVKVGRLGEKVREYALADPCGGGVSARTALNAANITVHTSEEVLVNGIVIYSLSTSVSSGNIVLVQLKATKPITVKVGRVGKPLSTVTLSNVFTAEEAMILANIRPSIREDIWLHQGKEKGIAIQKSTVLSEGDAIILETSRPRTLKDRLMTILTNVESNYDNTEDIDWEDVVDDIINEINE